MTHEYDSGDDAYRSPEQKRMDHSRVFFEHKDAEREAMRRHDYDLAEHHRKIQESMFWENSGPSGEDAPNDHFP